MRTRRDVCCYDNITTYIPLTRTRAVRFIPVTDVPFRADDDVSPRRVSAVRLRRGRRSNHDEVITIISSRTITAAVTRPTPTVRGSLLHPSPAVRTFWRSVPRDDVDALFIIFLSTAWTARFFASHCSQTRPFSAIHYVQISLPIFTRVNLAQLRAPSPSLNPRGKFTRACFIFPPGLAQNGRDTRALVELYKTRAARLSLHFSVITIVCSSNVGRDGSRFYFFFSSYL